MKDNQEKEILNILQQKQYATIEELSKSLYVSNSTVRRKLTDLQEKGLVIRTHGGVQINDDNNFFPSFMFRSHQNSLEKKKIALSAIKLIKNGDLIFLDGTTSSFFIAEYLSEFKNIKVVTNGIDTLSLLSKNKISAYSTGGFVSETNRSVLIGHIAEETISNLHADITFFSTQSISRDGEISDCFEEENVIRKSMMRHSVKNVFLCDETKFGKYSSYKLCEAKDVDYIITNRDTADYFTTDKLPKIIFDN